MPRSSGNALLFWSVVIVVVAADVVTKAWAVSALVPHVTTIQVIGDWV